MVKSVNYEEQKCLSKIASLYFILWQGSMYSCTFSPSELERFLILIFTSAQMFLLHKVICRLHVSTNK